MLAVVVVATGLKVLKPGLKIASTRGLHNILKRAGICTVQIGLNGISDQLKPIG